MSAGWQTPWRALSALGRLLADECPEQDVRAKLCQLLPLWLGLGLSLIVVVLAWRLYGEAVAALCYRTDPSARRPPGTALGPGPAGPNAHSFSPAGRAGRNGAAERHCLPWDGLAMERGKTHRE
ncbi:T-cell leukemia translocation-altered gene protein homolog [Neopsephotus bourkii]|uniref:T-cell leukemia translocation-altered gene protein homolog n=1 Tax=Neopsephotus bourkii TaxID=309878 RepID=UPI002AA515E4|nr:T-cell leukemia translocation-altered gene protein homolog [Neopsephotus bourkii]